MNVIKTFQSTWLKKAKEYSGNPSKMKKLADEAQTMLSVKGLKGCLQDFRSLIDYVRDIATGKYKDYSLSNLLLAIAAIVYVVSPLDVIPDFIPFGGFMDDATVVAWAVKQLSTELAKYRSKRRS